MKFCQRLRSQREVFGDEVVESIVDYKLLKKRISLLVQNNEGGVVSTADVAAWMEGFFAEVRKFDRYYVDTVRHIDRDLATAASATKTDLKELYLRVKELAFFVNLNKTAVRKILKKFDKNIAGHNVGRWREVGALSLPSYQETRLTDMSQGIVQLYAGMRC